MDLPRASPVTDHRSDERKRRIDIEAVTRLHLSLTVAFRRAGNIETDVTVSDRGAPAKEPASRR